MDKQDIKVSVIIPIYKVEKYLEKCILSVLNQTYRNLEIVLVDDGSPDECPSICDKYKDLDKRVIVVHKTNGGLSDARNAGLDIASGEFISFLDGDDTIDRKAIEILLSVALQENAKIVKMQFKNVYEGDDFTSECICNQEGRWITNSEYLKGICTYKASCSCCDKLFHREVIDQYRFRNGRTNEDLLFLGTILLERGYDIYSLDYQGYNYLQRRQSITNSVFGKSIRDTLYNCFELQEIARVKRSELYIYFQMLSLFQARTFILQMPGEYVEKRNEDFCFAMNMIKSNKRVISKSFFSLKNKLFLFLCLFNVSFAKVLVGTR